MPRKKTNLEENASEQKALEHRKNDRSIEKFDGTLDGLALTIKSKEQTEHGVRRFLIELMRHDDTMLKFVETADALASRKRASYPSLDVIANQSGTEHADVVGAIAKALHRFSYDYSRIIAAASMPRVMNTLANEAAHADGHRDRTLFLRATGHLPTGPSTQVNVQTTAIARSEASALAVTDGAASGLPSFEDEMKENVRAIRAINVLPA